MGLDGTSRYNKAFPQFVAREDQVLFLKSHGYKNVRGFGLPFLYANVATVNRKVGSVLVMPGHTLEEETEVADYQDCVRFVKALSEDFSNVVICLHGIDYDKGHARKAFEAAGFQVVRGAAIEDSNSLERMAFLFSRFEYVSTNFHGSHVYYAAAKGGKVSIAGPLFSSDPDGKRKHVYFQNFPEGLSFGEQVQELKQNLYPFFYVSLKNAEVRIDWALAQLGHHEKKSPQDLKKALGWSPMQLVVTKLKLRISDLINALKVEKP